MYGLQMIDKNAISRKLFFLNYENMLAAADTLIKAQQTTRVKQYKMIKKLPDNGISERKLVKHRFTHQVFVMQIIPHNGDQLLKWIASSQVKVL